MSLSGNRQAVATPVDGSGAETFCVEPTVVEITSAPSDDLRIVALENADASRDSRTVAAEGRKPWNCEILASQRVTVVAAVPNAARGSGPVSEHSVASGC